jgi:hypothetical protein
VLRDVPRRDYERIEFGIGVDAAANRSLTPRGDLDPNGRMAWTWEVGYKFVLFEGALVRGNASDPLVYHVGFNENYRLVSTELHGEPLDSRTARLDFRVDILRLFQGSATVDMAALPDVKFDRADAALLARNLPPWSRRCDRMRSINPTEPGDPAEYLRQPRDGCAAIARMSHRGCFHARHRPTSPSMRCELNQVSARYS